MAVRKQVKATVTAKNPTAIIYNETFITLKKVGSNFQDGFEKAKITKIEGISPVNAPTGLTQRAKVEFEVYMDDGNIKTLVQNFLLINHPKQPFYQLLMTIAGRSDGITPDDIIGKEVAIEIRNDKSEAGIFARVVSIFSVDELEEDNNETFDMQEPNVDNSIEKYEY